MARGQNNHAVRREREEAVVAFVVGRPTSTVADVSAHVVGLSDTDVRGLLTRLCGEGKLDHYEMDSYRAPPARKKPAARRGPVVDGRGPKSNKTSWG